MELNKNIYYVDEINNLAKSDEKLLIDMAENMFQNQIDDMIEDILNKHTKIILLAGPSSSGKTTTSKIISDKLHKKHKTSVYVSLDDFFLNRVNTPLLPNGNYDYENVSALDINYFHKFLNSLLTTTEAEMPKYNFLTGEREKEYVHLDIDDDTIVIIEGLHALNPILVNGYNDFVYKVYLCAQSDFYNDDECLLSCVEVRLLRRLLRDNLTRGRDLKTTITTWQEVLDGEKKYIDPYKNDVDFSLDSVHMYEPLLYANYLLPLLDAKDLDICKSLVKKLKHFEPITDKNVPKDSLLREFICN